MNSIKTDQQKPRPEAGPVEKWWQSVRQQTFRNLPLETALSHPVPVFQEGKLHLAAFYYGAQRSSGPGAGVARPPLARLLASYPEARLISFITSQAQPELFPGLPTRGDLGPLSAQAMTPDERMQERKSLFSMYSHVLDGFENKTSDPKLCQRFEDLFWRLNPPGLTPYYQALNPGFFDWLNSQ